MFVLGFYNVKVLLFGFVGKSVKNIGVVKSLWSVFID